MWVGALVADVPEGQFVLRTAVKTLGLGLIYNVVFAMAMIGTIAVTSLRL